MRWWHWRRCALDRARRSSDQDRSGFRSCSIRRNRSRSRLRAAITHDRAEPAPEGLARRRRHDRRQTARPVVQVHLAPANRPTGAGSITLFRLRCTVVRAQHVAPTVVVDTRVPANGRRSLLRTESSRPPWQWGRLNLPRRRHSNLECSRNRLRGLPQPRAGKCLVNLA